MIARRPGSLFWAVSKKKVLLLVRYPVNTLSDLVTTFGLFAIVFFGGRALAGAAITDSIEGIIVGFFLFTAAMVAFSGLSWNITRESQWGTLEQLFMSPYGFGTVMAVKTTVNVLYSFLWGGAILALMLVTTGRSLSIDPVTVLPLLALTLCSAVGVGFAVAGLAIRFKRIENAFQIVQFVFVGFIAAPVDRYPALGLLPLSQGSDLLQTAMKDGVALWHLAPGELAVLVGTAAGYLAVGFAAFHGCQRWARREGVMGHY